MCKISDKSDTFSLNYSNLFRGPLFSGHSVELPSRRLLRGELIFLTRFVSGAGILKWLSRSKVNVKHYQTVTTSIFRHTTRSYRVALMLDR